MDWFERLTGFPECGYQDARSKLAISRERLGSMVNGKSWAIGDLEMVSLLDLRQRAVSSPLLEGKSSVRVVQGDIRKMHAIPEYAKALFQVASQFNALEMTGPSVTPEDGVTRYQFDHTQGPACAIAAGPATIYRNYFVPVGDAIGQTKGRQLDGLANLGTALSAAVERLPSDLWTMRNGYALCSRDGLEAISHHLAGLTEQQIDDLRGHLSIAIQRGVEVTDGDFAPGQLVSQAFCSALPVAYTVVEARHWRPFASLVLEAAYEATLWEAAISASQGGSKIVLLTLLGGGAFGNESDWIFSAIRRGLAKVAELDIDVRIVSYGKPSPELRDLAAEFAD